MKLYDARVRLAGSIQNEAWVIKATPAELMLLLRIHDGGANYPLAEVKEVGSVVRSDERERARLRAKYLDWNLGNGDNLIREVLGPAGIQLAQTWDPPKPLAEEDFDDTIVEKTEEPEEQIDTLAKPVEIMKDRPVRTRVGRPPRELAA